MGGAIGGGKGGGSQPQQTTVTQGGLPAWLEGPLSNMVGRAQTLSQQEYTPYGGARVAELTAPELRSFDMVDDAVGTYKPYLDESATMTRGASQFNQDSFNNYLNPYMTGVVDRIGELGNRNLLENILPGVNDTFVRAGQGIGGGGNTDFTLRAIRDTQNEILGRQAEALAGSYDSAMGNYQKGQDRLLSSGAQMADIGSSMQGLGLEAAGAVGATGEKMRGIEQGKLDAAYQEHLNAMGWPMQQMGMLSSVLGSVPWQAFSSSTKNITDQGGRGNPLAQIAGIGLGIGMSPTSSIFGKMFGFKKGGRIPARGLAYHRSV